MGAVGALAPTTFEMWVLAPMVFGTNFHRNDTKNVIDLTIYWQKEISSTHSLRFLTGPL